MSFPASTSCATHDDKGSLKPSAAASKFVTYRSVLMRSSWRTRPIFMTPDAHTSQLIDFQKQKGYKELISTLSGILMRHLPAELTEKEKKSPHIEMSFGADLFFILRRTIASKSAQEKFIPKS
ncbi:MAG: hypothetical protein LUC45_03540 [Paraprevotella sp.]|nr:hypothetical protein [Paraprevotella sp.]